MITLSPVRARSLLVPGIAPSGQMTLLAAGFLTACFLMAAAAHFISLSVSTLIFAPAAVLLILLTAWRPAIGCAVLALSVPITAGLGRDTILPVLRISEAATIAVVIGALLYHLPRRSPGEFTGLDLTIGAYAVGVVVIPSLVLFTSRTPAGIDTWRYVLGPLQYVLVYWLFSRTPLGVRGMRAVANLAMAASVAAAVAGLLQLAGAPGVRPLLAAVYPLGGGGEPLCPYGICRPMSFLEHAPAFGGYALLGYILALALAARRHPSFPSWWLATAMAVNAAAVLASQTQAAVIGLVVATVLISWHARAVPRQLLPTAAALVIGTVAFFPQVSARVEQQFGGGTGTPQSLSTRYQYWGEYFLPDLADHLLLGTGTVIPPDIPAQLTTYVDNEYLRLGYRAGLVGLVLLLAMYPTMAVVGWRLRHDIDPWKGAIGGAAVAYVAVMAIMGTTAEYLTFSGVSQQFWMAAGLLAAVSLGGRSRRPAIILGELAALPRPDSSGPRMSRRSWRVAATRGMAPLGSRWLPEPSLLRSSAIVLAGNMSARFLGFLFSLAAARLLLPSGYGVFAYGLTIATIGSTLITDTPIGLSRSLPLLPGRQEERNAIFSNTLVAMLITLTSSILLTVVGASFAGVHGWMLAAVGTVLVGNAAYFMFRETMRGQERYVPMVVIFVVANFLELVAILIATATGHAYPALFLALYGLSYVAAILLLLPLTPLGLSFDLSSVNSGHVSSILRFVSPLFLQTAFLTIWLGADLILVNRLLSSASAGQYAAAKTVANVFYLVPAAIGGPLLPRVARLASEQLRSFVLRVLALVTLVSLPPLAVLLLLRHPMFNLLFGARYGAAAAPFALVAIAMSLYGLYQVLEHTWVARGRPLVDTLATGCGALATCILLFVLLPEDGLTGAAIAFLLGAVVQLAVIGAISVFRLGLDGRDQSIPAEVVGGR